MKKFSILFLALIFAGIACAQKVERQQIKRITQADYNLEWYQTQKKLWKKEVDKNPKSENAWWNYYEAERGILHKSGGNPFTEESPAMDIVNEMEKSIPNTFTFYHCKANQLGNHTKDFSKYLIKAYELQPNNPLTYENLIVYYEMVGNLTKRKEVVNKLYKYGEVSPGHLNLGYNLLMTADEDAVLITGGDNDTYPLWVLQDVFGIRKDVKVVNRWMIKDSSYAKVVLKSLGINYTKAEKKKVIRDTELIKNGEDHANHTAEFIKLIASKPGKEVFLAQTAWREGLYGLADMFYNVGLAFQFSETDIDNIALVKRNYKKRYRMDYVLNAFYKDPKSSLISYANSNYAPSLILIYQHAKEAENTEEVEWAKKYLVEISKNASKAMKGYINYYLNLTK